MFHHFHSHSYPRAQGAISSQQFEDMLVFLQKRKTILAASDWMEKALRGKLKSGEICLTFDDNLRCQHDLALPVLRQCGITAFWFINTSALNGGPARLEVYRYFRTACFNNIEEFYSSFFAAAGGSAYGATISNALSSFDPTRYLPEYPFYTDNDRKFRFVRNDVLGVNCYNALMDFMIETSRFDVKEVTKRLCMDGDCLRTLSTEGHVLGLHSHTHPTYLSSLSEECQRTEFELNCQHLRAIIKEKPKTMAHPCNSYNTTTLAVLRKMGIRLGFRANMVEHSNQFNLEYPREDHANVLREMKAERGAGR
jgi:peptidoglycan/xylan/chitin deacetylase (PgdA/CDA1 family)